MATAEFSKFAGILSAALSQHHFLGFEIAHLEPRGSKDAGSVAIPKTVQTTTQLQLISHTSKVMLKILQARLQQYVNHELPDVQAGFRKGGTRD